MQGFHLHVPYPGATTAIVIGLVDRPGTDFDGFRAVLWVVDAAGTTTTLRTRPGTVVEVVGLVGLGKGLETVISRFIARDPRHMPSLFITANAAEGQAALYQPAIREIHLALEAQHRARFTRQQDGFLWQKHVLTNAGAYVRQRLPAAWAGRLAGIPAVVCGAGPSLDVSGAALAKAADGAVVFAADSALRTLARQGLRADFAVSIDVAKVPEKCLPEPAFAPVRTVLSAVSPPAWREVAHAGERLFLSGRQITLDWLVSLGVGRTPVAAEENCGATALEVARFLGCAPIYLFGLDLALDANDPRRRNTREADAGLYERSGFDATRQMPLVPGNHAAEVPTHVIGDWRALDARLAGWPAGLVHNVNDRGAKLRNTVLVAPADFRLEASATKARKESALAGLTDADLTGPAAKNEGENVALGELRKAGFFGRTRLPAVREALAKRGPAEAATQLRTLFLDAAFGRAMGAFSLKVMPHLVPPIEGEAAFWRGLLDECAELCDLAASA